MNNKPHTVIVDMDANLYFKGFTNDGGIRFTKDVNEALEVNELYQGDHTNQAIIKRMLSAWHGKPFSKLGYAVINTVDL